jgi:UDP-N-acetylglucosamine pyrophosphorylase
VSIKCCIKENPLEKVGLILIKNGKYDIAEYSESVEIQSLRKEEGNESSELKYNLGSLAVFLVRTDKFMDLCGNTSELNKMYHIADKSYDYYDN